MTAKSEDLILVNRAKLHNDSRWLVVPVRLVKAE